MGFLLRVSVLIYIFLPLVARAHIKWFVEVSPPTLLHYSFLEWQVWIGILLIICVLIAARILETKSSLTRKAKKKITAWEPLLTSIAQAIIGIALIIFSLQSFVFAPNFHTEQIYLLTIQAFVGLSFIFGFYTRIGGILLLILYVLASLSFGWIPLLDACEFLGVGIFTFIAGRPRLSFIHSASLDVITKSLRPYALPFLRIFLGLNLLILAFTEKLLHPDLGVLFLQTNTWNFMNGLGVSVFTDYWFVFAAGICEALFGMLLISGFITRTTTILLSIFLIATLILLGPLELVGHLPHFAVALLLITIGSGTRLKIRIRRH